MELKDPTDSPDIRFSNQETPEPESGFRWGLSVALMGIVLFTLPASVKARESGFCTERVVVRIDAQHHSVSGTFELSDCPNGQTLSQVPVQAYLPASRYAVQDPDLDDVNVLWRLPYGMSLSKSAYEDAGGQAVVADDDGWIDLPRLSDGAGRWGLAFQIQFPLRTGPFAAGSWGLGALGGLFPLVPVQPGEEESGSGLHVSRNRELVVEVARGEGLIVVGNHFSRVASGRPATFRLQSAGPLPFIFLSEFSLTRWRSRDPSVPEVWGIIPCQRCNQELGRMESTVSLVGKRLEKLPSHSADARFLVVQIPLRETPALPFPGGIAVSDRFLRLTPLGPLRQRHIDALNWMVVAGWLIQRPGWTLDDALLWVRMMELVAQSQGHREALLLKEFFREGEVLATLDTIGTDPQTGFESTLFFRSAPPGELESLPERVTSRSGSPTFVARQALLLLGLERAVSLLESAMSDASGLSRTILRSLTGDSEAIFAAAMHRRESDLRLVSIKRHGSRWNARVCVEGDQGPLVLEAEARRGLRRKVRSAQACLSDCCDLDVGEWKRRPRVVLDPDETLPQVTLLPEDPRRNDRLHPDLKWMIARPYLSMARGDRLPTTSFELVVQPRYDLRHQGFFGPFLTPDRLALAGGYRMGVGPRVRPNLRMGALSLGLRGALGLENRGQVSWGPMLVLDAMSTGSRPNPAKGFRAMAYAYPYASAGLDKMGLRGGAGLTLYGRPWLSWVVVGGLKLDGVAGWFPPWEAIQVGGIGGMRGLSSTGPRTRYRVGGSLELRWMLFQGADAPVLDLLFLRGLQLALFVDAASLTRGIHDVGSTDSLYTNVGLGLRPHVDWLGFIPGILSLDVAWLLPVGAVNSGSIGILFGLMQPL